MTVFELINQTLSGILGNDWTSLLLPGILIVLILFFLKR